MSLLDFVSFHCKPFEEAAPTQQIFWAFDCSLIMCCMCLFFTKLLPQRMCDYAADTVNVFLVCSSLLTLFPLHLFVGFLTLCSNDYISNSWHYSESLTSLRSQWCVLLNVHDSSFKETFELSNLSLNGSTELRPPPVPSVKRWDWSAVSCHSCLRFELLFPASDFHWDSGQYSRGHTQRLCTLHAAAWMKGRANTVCKVSPYCCPALSLCVCVCSRWDWRMRWADGLILFCGGWCEVPLWSHGATNFGLLPPNTHTPLKPTHHKICCIPELKVSQDPLIYPLIYPSI